MKLILAMAATLLVSACAVGANSRDLPSVFDPYCMPDGSPVFVQHANMAGSYEGALASKENCPWYKAE